MAAVRVPMSNMGKTITVSYLDILDNNFKRQDVHYKALTGYVHAFICQYAPKQYLGKAAEKVQYVK